MSENGLRAAVEKMRAANVAETAIRVFEHYYALVESGETGMIPEDSIEPLVEPQRLGDVEIDDAAAREAFGKTVMIKLNGGLGTSMGLAKAKTLLPVRDGKSFLDLIVQQVLWARAHYGVRLPLIFMNSYRTQADTLAALGAYPDLPVDGLPLDFVQNQEPKLRADDLTPVDWPADPELEWCPPGHGDLYTALLASGVLDELLARGFRYASVANGDNLGSYPSPRLAGWFAASGAPFACEVCPRTEMDRKGGHLAVRKSDGRLTLRDTAMVLPDEMDHFTDIERHSYFNTNNLWFDLAVLAETIKAKEGVLGLPLIRNVKTVDPTDPSSPEVVQIETGMGTSIEVFDGAAAIAVERERFLPVKTTNELMLVRSDVFRMGDDALLTQVPATLPTIKLASRWYKNIADFDARVPQAPSLRRATRLEVDGDWTFAPDVEVIGAAVLSDPGAPGQVSGRIGE